jgi:hypothetical protein
MRNQNPAPSEHNASMSERDKQKTVSNPSPGSSDPGNDKSASEGRDTARKPV